MTDGPLERARENVTGIVSVLVTGIWMAALFTDQSWWLAALLVGYVVVVPVTGMLFDDEEEAEAGTDASRDTTSSSPDADGDAALERLRERYAAGELTDEQFERKLERLLETEHLEDVEDARRERERLSESG